MTLIHLKSYIVMKCVLEIFNDIHVRTHKHNYVLSLMLICVDKKEMEKFLFVLDTNLTNGILQIHSCLLNYNK